MMRAQIEPNSLSTQFGWRTKIRNIQLTKAHRDAGRFILDNFLYPKVKQNVEKYFVARTNIFNTRKFMVSLNIRTLVQNSSRILNLSSSVSRSFSGRRLQLWI